MNVMIEAEAEDYCEDRLGEIGMTTDGKGNRGRPKMRW